MISELPVTAIAHAIQLAVAPVFLLTGVASILSVLTNRLSRIIDRSRFLHLNLFIQFQYPLQYHLCPLIQSFAKAVLVI